MVSITDLPDDVFERIFSFCSFKDLVNSIQFVNMRWLQLSRTNCLWKNLVYLPSKDDDDEVIVRTLMKSPKLQSLQLCNTLRNSALKDLLKYGRELRTLWFHEEQKLSAKYLKSMKDNCTNLKELLLSSLVFTDILKVKEIGNFNSLTTLAISEFEVYKRLILRPIADGCPSLSCFHLHNESFCIGDLIYFLNKKGKTLHELTIPCKDENRHCTFPLLEMCPVLTKLSVLDLFDCSQKRLPENLSKLSSLQLYMGYCDCDISLIKSIFSLPNMVYLSKLTLLECSAYDDSLTEVICNKCPHLNTFKVSQWVGMSGESIRMLCALKELTDLSIDNCKRVGDEMSLLGTFVQLKKLSLGECVGIPPESMARLTNITGLRKLKLFDCDLEGFPLHVIPDKMKTLTLLSVIECCSVTNDSLKELKKKMPQLQIVASNNYDNDGDSINDFPA